MKHYVRRKVHGRCQDCGHEIPTRVVIFWSSDMHYRVCRECELAYRGVICWPITHEMHDSCNQRCPERVRSWIASR